MNTGFLVLGFCTVRKVNLLTTFRKPLWVPSSHGLMTSEDFTVQNPKIKKPVSFRIFHKFATLHFLQYQGIYTAQLVGYSVAVLHYFFMLFINICHQNIEVRIV